MRTLALLLAGLPVSALAETYTLPSVPSAATVYANFAMVTRTVSVDVAGGAHEVLLPDLPQWVDTGSLRVRVSGAQLTSTRLRTNALPPQPDTDSPQIIAAKDRINQAERALQVLDDRKLDAGLAATAAAARLAFLQDLGASETLPSDPQALADLAQMIEAQTLAATQTQIAAQRAARDVEDGRAELTKELRDARDALAALTPPAEPTALLALFVNAEDAGAVQVSVQYPVQASWVPTYDIFLDRGDADTVTLRRAAHVSQNSGENWSDVALTLSTLAPSGRVVPSELFPRLLRFQDKELLKTLGRSVSADMVAESAPAPVMEVQLSTAAQFDGPGVRYEVPQTVSLAHGAEAARIALDALAFDARVFARAVPSADATAFLMAEATNASQEPLLAAPTAQLFVDGALVGQTNFAAVPAGGQLTQAFGPIEDIRLTRAVLDRSEGDRGLINRSNAQTQEVLLTLENLGTENWDVEVMEAIPYSEQDDLVIDWSASPSATQTDVDDRRGLMQWDIALAAGASQEIAIEQSIRWPDGKILR